MVLFYTLQTNNYGGNCQGARWAILADPLLVRSRSPRLSDRCCPSAATGGIAYLLLIVSLSSVAFAWSGHREDRRPGPWSSSWLHLAMRSAGWIDY